MRARIRLVIVLCIVVVGGVVGGSWLMRRLALVHQELGYNDDSGNTRLLGRVERGQIGVLLPQSSSLAGTRLTVIQMQESQSPESRELDLAPYEGQVIVVEGHDGGGWLYGTKVVDTFTPTVSWILRWLPGYR